jgi:metal transporter CNNM
VSSGERKLGELIPRFRQYSGREGDDIVEDDVVLSWGEQPRVLTGTDIPGRLLRKIARVSRDAEPLPVGASTSVS